MGCFWGAERIFWQIDGVHSTAVGYMGGFTKNPTYEETCTARTGHTETVQVVYDPAKVDLDVLMKAFWENHDPTTPNRQGNDVGTQYRSAIYTTTAAAARRRPGLAPTATRARCRRRIRPDHAPRSSRSRTPATASSTTPRTTTRRICTCTRTATATTATARRSTPRPSTVRHRPRCALPDA